MRIYSMLTIFTCVVALSDSSCGVDLGVWAGEGGIQLDAPEL